MFKKDVVVVGGSVGGLEVFRTIAAGLPADLDASIFFVLHTAPEAPGLLAASLGLSRMYSDDLAQLEAGLTLYDAFYRWCRDATDETHNWPSAKPGERR